MTESSKLAMPTKLAFGIGATGESSTNWIFNALKVFFYNRILGLSGTLAAAAATSGFISDAITDSLIPTSTDR